MKIITEKEKQTPVTAHCGVLVAGGGIAGISAALAAARNGADVLLIERECILGGLATLGLITISRVSQLMIESISESELNGRFDDEPILPVRSDIIAPSSHVLTH